MEPADIHPRGDRVLVETIKDRQIGNVFIPDQIAEGRPERARVLAVGPGARNPKTGELQPLDISVGEVVFFHRHAGTHIGGLKDDFIIFREQDILATMDE